MPASADCSHHQPQSSGSFWTVRACKAVLRASPPCPRQGDHVMELPSRAAAIGAGREEGDRDDFTLPAVARQHAQEVICTKPGFASVLDKKVMQNTCDLSFDFCHQYALNFASKRKTAWRYSFCFDWKGRHPRLAYAPLQFCALPQSQAICL